MTKQQVTVSTQDLQSALSYVPKSAKKAMGILSAIMFEVTKESLSIKSVTGHSGYIYTMDAVANVPFTFCVPANIVNLLLIGAKEELTLVVTESQVKVKGTKLKATLLADVDCFPNVPSYEDAVTFDFEPVDLESLIQLSAYVAEPSKGILRGVNIAKEDGAIYLSATDSFRFIRKRILTNCDHDFNATLLMDDIACIKAFNEAAYVKVSIVSDVDDIPTLMFFEQDNVVFYTSLLQGNYPQLSNLIKSKTEFLFETDLLGKDVKAVCDAVKQLQAASENDRSTFTLKKDGDQLLGGLANAVGEVWLPVTTTDYESDDDIAAYNLIFFTALTKDNWLMKCGGSTGFSLFLSKDGFTTYVLMPVQLR